MTYAVARVAAVLATAVLVAGCATTSTNTLAQAKRYFHVLILVPILAC